MKGKQKKKELNSDLFMKIKDNQTRCLDTQRGSKVEGLQKYFTTH